MALMKCLGSSSKGNCYSITFDDGKILILDCGFSFSKIKKFIDFNLKDVLGVLLTHEHKDHSKSIIDFINSGIPCFMSKGTALALDIKRAYIIKSEKQFKIGNIYIMPFSLDHDVNEPLGFLIQEDSVGKILFATDTRNIKYNFKNLNHVFIEANYDLGSLSKNINQESIPRFIGERIIDTHMEIDTTINFLIKIDNPLLESVTLLHLSDSNSNESDFKNRVEKEIKKDVNVASCGFEKELNIIPWRR